MLVILLLLVTVVSVFAAVTSVLTSQLRSPEQAAADAAPPQPSRITVAAEVRVLTEPLVLRGQVRQGASVKLFPPVGAVGAESVVTKVGIKIGQNLDEGSLIAERNGAPLIALVLPFALYRDLTNGLKGPDVVEIQKALRRLGYGNAKSGTFDTATQQSVVRLYRALGYDPLRQEAAGSVTTPPTGDQQQESPVFFPKNSVVAIDQSGRKVTAVSVRVGSVLLDPQVAILELDAKLPFVVATATAGQSAFVSVEQVAHIRDEASGAQADAVVTSVTTGATGTDVTFSFTGPPLQPSQDRTVRIDVEPAARSVAVLAVPVTAVYSRPDGTTISPGGEARDVNVDVGEIAGGWAGVTPDDQARLGSPAVPVGA